MIAFLAIVYAAIAYLIFFQFKLLPFDLKNKIATAVLGVLIVCGILIAVNFFHPMTLDATVYQHIIQIAPRTPAPARVVEVPVKPNMPLKKGDVLFRLDPRPYQYEVDRLTALVAASEQSVPQLKAQLDAAEAAANQAEAQEQLAQVTYDRDMAVFNRDAGAISDLKIDESRQHLAGSQAAVHQAKAQVEASRIALEMSGETIAQAKAQLNTARLNLEETTVTAPADGFATVVELRPGFVVTPGQSVMSFVAAPEGIVGATFAQEYASNIQPGDEVELCLDVYPGKTLHGVVESVIKATGEGQLDVTGMLQTTAHHGSSARIPVKISISETDQKLYPLPAGASGAAAIYTDHVPSFKIVRRVMLRWYTWLNYVKLTL